MATFNKEPTDIQPINIGFSTGTEKPFMAGTVSPSNIKSLPTPEFKADTTQGQGLTNFAKALDSASSTLDNIYKSFAKEETQSGLEKIRDAWTQDLNTATGSSPLENAQGDTTNTPNGGEDIPQGLATMPRTANALKDARTQGKLTEGDYWQRTEAYVRQMRARYPGHKDYVDQVAQHVLGTNPANALWRTRLEALTRMASEGRSESDKITNYVNHNAKDLNEADILRLGKTLSYKDAMTLIQVNQSRRRRVEEARQDLALVADQGKATANDAGTYLTGAFNHEVDNAIYNVTNAQGPGTTGDLMTRLKQGQTISSEEKQMLLTALVNGEQDLRRRLDNTANRPLAVDGPDGPMIMQRSPLQMTEPSDYRSRYDQAINRYTALRTAVEQDNLSYFHIAETTRKADNNQFAIALQRAYPKFQLAKAIRENLGDAYAAQWMSKPGEGGGSDLLNSIDTVHMDLIFNGSYNGYDDAARNNKAAFNGQNPALERKAFENFIKEPIKFLLDPEVQRDAKVKLARFVFSDQNTNTLNALRESNPDAYNALYETISSPAMQSAVIQLKTEDPKAWFAYKQYVYKQFTARNKQDLSSVNAAIEQGAPIVLNPSTNSLELEKVDANKVEGSSSTKEQTKRLNQVGFLQQGAMDRVNLQLKRLNMLLNADNPGLDVSQLLSVGIPNLSMARKIPGVKLGSNGQFYIQGPDGVIYQVMNG